MARIPTPVAPGQEVGSVKQQFTATPFQNINAPIEAFGGGDANIAAALAPGVGAFASDLAAYNKEKDNSALLDMEDEISKAKLNREMEISSLEGQARLDVVGGVQGKGPGGPRSSVEIFNDDISAIRAKYNFVTDAADQAANRYLSSSETSMKAFVFEKGQEAKKLVAKQQNASRIATAVQGAVSSIGSPRFETEVKKALSVAESTVTADGGMADQGGTTDPVSIELMVKEQQGAVINGVVTDMLAKGNFSEAVAFTDKHTQGKGILSGTETGSQLRAKMLPFIEEVSAQQGFQNLLGEVTPGPLGTPSIAALTAEVNKPGRDPREAAQLRKQLSMYVSVDRAKTQEAIDSEMQAVTTAAKQNQPITIDMIPTLWRTNQLAALGLLTGKGARLREDVVNATNQDDWSQKGGGSSTIQEADTYLKKLAVEKPGEFLALMQSKTFTKFFKKDDYKAFQDRQATVQKRYDDERSKTINMRKLLGSFGIKDKDGGTQATRLINEHGRKITEAINGVRTDVLDNGGTVEDADIKRAVAGVLVKVRTKDRPILNDVYDFASAPDVEAEGGNIGDMSLQDSSRNRNFAASILGVSPSVIKAAAEDMSDDERTLNNLAKKIGVANPTVFTQHDDFENAIGDMSRSAGLPSDFIRWIYGNTNEGNAPRTPEALGRFMLSLDAALADENTSLDKVLQRWIKEQGAPQ